MTTVNDDIKLTHWAYDLEVFPNIFSMCIIRADGSNCRIWEVSDRKNDTEASIVCPGCWMRKQTKKRMVVLIMWIDTVYIHDS